MANASRGFNGSKQNQVILHGATDSEPFGCRSSGSFRSEVPSV